MAIVIPSVTKGQFTAVIEKQTVAPVLSIVNINIPLNFSVAANLESINGSYTPNNDYRYLLQSIPSGQVPTFLMVTVDNPMALAIGFQKSVITYSPTRFTFLEWVNDPSNQMLYIFIDGRTGPNPANTPMVQGQTVNYSIVYGQATIS